MAELCSKILILKPHMGTFVIPGKEIYLVLVEICRNINQTVLMLSSKGFHRTWV